MTKFIKACDSRESAKAIEFLHFWLNSIALYSRVANDDHQKIQILKIKALQFSSLGLKKI